MSKLEENLQTTDGEEQLVPEHASKTSSTSRHRLLLYILLTTTCLLLLTGGAITLEVIFHRDDVDKLTTIAPTTSPLQITAVAFGNDTISLRWEKQDDQPISGYKLTISPAPMPGPDVIITESDVDGAEFTGLTAGTNHAITLEAIGATNLNSKIEQYTSPNTPEHIQFDYQKPDLIIFEWSPPKYGNVELYRVYRYEYTVADFLPKSATATPKPRDLMFEGPATNLTAPATELIDYGSLYRFDIYAVVGKNKDIESEPLVFDYSESK